MKTVLKTIGGVLVIWLVGWVPFLPIDLLFVPREHASTVRALWILGLMILYIVGVIAGWFWPTRKEATRPADPIGAEA